jgi:ABC-type glutathione transport system ATPase component
LAIQEYLQLVQPSSHRGVENAEPLVAVFRNIKVWGDDTRLIYQKTITSLITSPLRALFDLFSRRRTTKKLILEEIEGVVKEGEMLLVLGRPGSGCSTLLKTLAGMTGSFRGWTGDIMYSGVSIHEIKERFGGDVIYNAEGVFERKFVSLLICN